MNPPVQSLSKNEASSEEVQNSEPVDNVVSLTPSLPNSTDDTIESVPHVMAKGLDVLIEQLPKAAGVVQHSTEELTRRFLEIAKGVQHQGDQVNIVIEMTKSLECEGERISYDEFNELFIKTINNSIDKIVSISKQAINMVYKMDQAIHCLSGMQSFVEDIESINKQANLLALNATIEAEKAGEAGLSFGVVADEVKQVSKQVSRISVQMREQISQANESVSEGYTLLQNMAVIDLTENITAKEKLDMLISSMLKQGDELNQVLSNTIDATKDISQNISASVMGLQFQDKNSQQIENSVNLLKHIQDYLLKSAQNNHGAQDDGAISLEDEIHLLAKIFSLNEFRQCFLEKCQRSNSAATSKAQDSTSSNPIDDIELF